MALGQRVERSRHYGFMGSFAHWVPRVPGIMPGAGKTLTAPIT